MPVRHAKLTKNAYATLLVRYQKALHAHVRARQGGPGDPARNLGRTALACGLVTLDVAIMHELAMDGLASTHDFGNPRNGLLKRAGLFFSRAISPLEAAHRATREAVAHLQQRNRMLHLHAAALAKGNRRLEREVARREAGEVSIRHGAEKYRRLFLESQTMQRKLRQLTRQIISAQEEERKQLSRELHDGVVQLLVGINVKLAALGKGVAADRIPLQHQIAQTRRLVESSVVAVHRFARELRPAVLDDLGLIPALHAFSKNLAERKKIKIHLVAFAGVERLADGQRTVLFRVAQEALTNVTRHANASQVRLDITAIPGGVRMVIRDNGQSFPVEKILGAKNPKRLGLVGMRERLEMLGGTLAIESQPGYGTTVRAELPTTFEKSKS